MADSPSNPEPQECASAPLLERIAEKRRAAAEFSTAQREGLEDLEARIEAELNRVAASLSKERSESERADAARQSIAQETQSLEEKSAELAQREESLAARITEIDARQAELDARQAEIDRQQQERDESERQQQTALEQARYHLDQQSAEIAQHTTEVERREAELTAREEALRAAQQEFDNQHAEAAATESAASAASAEQVTTLTAELEAARGELESVRAENEAARAELARRDEQSVSGDSDVERVRLEVEEKSQLLAAAEARIDKLVSENAALQDCVNEAADRLQGDAPDAAELTALTEQRDAAVERSETLAEQVRDLEQRCEEVERQKAAPSEEGSEELEDLRRRHEMAMDDLRELKQRNAELESRATKPSPAADSGGDAGLDWEAQKQRLLAQLDEIDEQDETPEERADRLKIEEIIRKTDAAVASKEKELADLRQLLEEQSNNLGEMAVGAAALGQLFDTDEIVKQERERLAQIQAEWEAKLREAEIEVSVERAKIARERAQLDERQQKLEQLHAREQAKGEAADEPKSKGGSRGRWLSRLGLKDQEE